MSDVIGQKAAILKALGHPTRLFIAERLLGGSTCVCELVDEIDADFSTVSHHLSILRNHGIVRSDKQGRSVYYTLEMPCLIRSLDCVERIIQRKAENALEAQR